MGSSSSMKISSSLQGYLKRNEANSSTQQQHPIRCASLTASPATSSAALSAAAATAAMAAARKQQQQQQLMMLQRQQQKLQQQQQQQLGNQHRRGSFMKSGRSSLNSSCNSIS